MWHNPTEEQLSKIPKLYSTDFIQPLYKKIFMHFFLGDSDWYIAEFDGKDLFYGFAILNGDTAMSEWGYISFSELKFFEIEHDLYWKIRYAKEVKKIRKCMSGI